MPQTARRYIEIEVEASKALRSLRGIEDAAKGTERSMTSLQKQFQTFGNQLRGFLGFLGAQQLVGFADAATDIETRLLAVTATAQQSEEVFQSLLDITGKLGVGVSELARSYAQLAVALPERSTDEIILALDTVSTVLATTGASTQQVNAVLLQLNQALASATLQGDELRSVYENAPVLLKAWQEAADFTTQSIKELSAAGAFTTESFFELLPAIREISIEMIGMEQPALTIARAFEILTSNIIALLKDSESVSIVMGAVANAVVLVAENLDLLVTAATAFLALKLPGYLKRVGGNLGLVSAGMGAFSLTQEALAGHAEAWLEFIDILRDGRRVSLSMVGSFEKLRAVVNSTAGRFIALFAVFESWSWAIDRINEASKAMDTLVERVGAASAESTEFVDEITKIRDLNIDTASFAELEEGFTFTNNAVKEFNKEIAAAERELMGLVNAAGNVSFETRLFDPEAAARADFLAQRLVTLERQLQIAKDASNDMSAGMTQLDSEMAGVIPSFEQLNRELSAFASAGKRVATQRFKIQAELELSGLEGEARVRRQIEQFFEAPIRQAGIAIDDALTRLTRLNEVVRFTEQAEEVAKLREEIDKQNAVVEKNVSLIRAVQEARASEEASLVQQTLALEDATQAQNDLTAALEREEEAIKQQERLSQNLQAIERAAAVAAARVREYVVTGEEGLQVFDSMVRVQEAFNKALEDQETTLEEATPRQLAYAQAVAAAQSQLEGAQRAGRAAQQVRDLAEALTETQNAAVSAEGALRAFNQGGASGLMIFERQQRLQDTFSESLRQQGVTYQTASQEQLNYARQATRALEEQLRAQDKLNRAQQESSDIVAARARVESIGVNAGAPIQDFGDISRVVDDITVAAVNGNQQSAQALFDIAEQNLRRLAQDVSGGFSERELERAKSELAAIADLVFQQPDAPPGATALDAEVAAAAELTVPTLVAPISIDQESLDQSLADVQSRLSSQTFTIQIEPELVGLALDSVVGQTVNQEGSTPL